MVQIKYKNWENIPLGKYNQILDLIKDYQEDEELETEIKIISILSDVPENEIWNTPIEHLRGIRNQISFVYNTRPDWKNYKVKNIKIGKYDCDVICDMNIMTVAQYVDFQQYVHLSKNVNAEILSTFIIPKGMKYGDGYDLDDLVENIKKELPVGVAQSIFNFFLRHSLLIVDNFLFYHQMMMKFMKMPSNLKPYKKRVLKLMKQSRKNLQRMYGFHSLI